MQQNIECQVKLVDNSAELPTTSGRERSSCITSRESPELPIEEHLAVETLVSSNNSNENEAPIQSITDRINTNIRNSISLDDVDQEQPQLPAFVTTHFSQPGAFRIYPGGRTASDSSSDSSSSSFRISENEESGIQLEGHNFFGVVYGGDLEEEPIPDELVFTAELAETLDRQERDRIKEEVRRSMAAEAVKAELVEEGMESDRSRNFMWVMFVCFVAVALVLIVLTVVIPNKGGAPEPKFPFMDDDDSVDVKGSGGHDRPEVQGSGKMDGAADLDKGKQPQSTLPKRIARLDFVKIYALPNNDGNFPIDVNMLTIDDYRQLSEWTLAFCNETLSSHFLQSIENATFQYVSAEWSPLRITYGTLNLLGFRRITVTYQGDPNAFGQDDLWDFLLPTVAQDLAAYVQSVDEIGSSAFDSTESFGMSMLESHDEFTDDPFVDYVVARTRFSISLTVPNSTSIADIRTSKKDLRDATTLFLETHLPDDVIVLDVSPLRFDLGSSCLPPPSEDMSTVYFSFNNVLKVGANLRDTYIDIDSLFELLRQTFEEFAVIFLLDYVQ